MCLDAYCFLVVFFFSLQWQRIRSRSVLQNAPRRGRCPCTVRGGLAGKREIGMRRKRGFSVHTRTSRLHTASTTVSVSFSLSLSPLRLPLSGRWCGKSVVLTGTRWSTTLKAVVAVKEEGCTLEGKRWVDGVREGR